MIKLSYFGVKYIKLPITREIIGFKIIIPKFNLLNWILTWKIPTITYWGQIID